MDVKYTYKNIPIIGGGFVTGLLFHPEEKGLLYARTDVGMTYRFDFDLQRWTALGEDMPLSPLSVAVDRFDAGKLYTACGQWGVKNGVLGVSHDRGNSFVYREIPARVNGNCPGRGTGERLIAENNRLLFGSPEDGLLLSEDEGASWRQIDVNGEKRFTFVFAISGTDIAAAGCCVGFGAADPVRQSLYVSYDRGCSFEPAEVPESCVGFTATGAVFDGKHLYVSMNKGEKPWQYSCDSGAVKEGRLLRYDICNGRLGVCSDITPKALEGQSFGIGGIAANEKYTLFSTVCDRHGDRMFRTTDSGESWETVISSTDPANYHCRCSYMKPKYNDGTTVIHWESSVKSDPSDPDTAFFNTGTGVFRMRGLLEERVYFEDISDGIEETVHMNVYSPPSGSIVLLDAVGDLGGFAFDDTDKPCENTFADENGKRFITVMNIDWCDSKPEIAVCTPRGNWIGSSKGGTAVSKDGGLSWRRCSMPYGISEEIDALCKNIEKPNVNSGWTAVTADGETIVWTVCDRFRLSAVSVVFSDDGGRSWARSKVYDIQGSEISDPEVTLKAMSDRVNADIIYGFGNNGEVFISTDKGRSFWQKCSPLPSADMGFCDGKNRTEIRCQCGKEGVIWLALGSFGLWRLRFDDGEFAGRRVTAEGVSVLAQGMGKGADGSKSDALYIAVGSERGSRLMRSLDEGESWQEISGEGQYFGNITTLCGDQRKFGRVYFGTGGRGLFVGEESENTE